MAKGKKGRKGRKNQGKGISENIESELREVTLGWEKAGIGASVTFSGDTLVISLGIGIAAVEYDLGEPNNSTVSYAFDLYEISGERDGCTVTLEYRIAGALVKTETRRIPNCEDEKEQEEDKQDQPLEDDPGEEGGQSSSDDPPGNLWDTGYYLLGLAFNRKTVSVVKTPLYFIYIYRDFINPAGRIIEDEDGRTAIAF
ncbi:MAG: hypothetical protein F6K54_24300 [Okeania sp. SIO3B5]|uniref:hypothetical protein n=1 Tax=Okeania sp. SIO3B5 TaxID=2607811 RepID=UPI0013FFBC4B|nr:hypothetical protein [Okeania sp. SIO3B5]NEO55912.1 hypothetical protein [Okeania sp. SIO3B5]